MIKWALRKALEKFERDWKYDGSYMRDIIDASPRAAWLYSRAAALGQFRRDVPIEAWYAAGITAVRHEDCGPCTQLGVAMAERAGVCPAVLRAVLTDNPEAMPADVALVWKFTRATLAHDAAADEYREVIVISRLSYHHRSCMAALAKQLVEVDELTNSDVSTLHVCALVGKAG